MTVHAEIITIRGDRRVVVQAPWNQKELIKSVIGARWDDTGRLWHVPLSWATYVQLLATFRDELVLGTELVEWAWAELRRRVEPAVALRARLELTDDERVRRHAGLYQFQQLGAWFLDVAGSALLGDEMGTGKTIQQLALFHGAADPLRYLPALVVSPKSVQRNWAREAARWFPAARPYVIEGGAARKTKTLTAAALDPLALIMMNYETLRSFSRLAPYGSIALRRCVPCGGRDPKITTARCEVHRRPLNELDLRTVVLDEAHRIKDPAAKQTRAAWAVGHGSSVRHRFALTGTPISRDLADLWSIMHFLDPVEHPVKSQFIDRYGLVSWGRYGGMEVVAIHPERRDEFYKIFNPRFRRVTITEAGLQLPPKVYSVRYVELTPKQRRAYDELEGQVVTRLEDGTLVVATDLENQLRMIQLASAYLEGTGEVDDEGKPLLRLCDPSPKVDELVDILADLGPDEQVAVCAEHRQLIELAALRLSRLKISYGLLTGRQSSVERDVALRDFQEGRTRVLLFTIKAGGEGLTMTAARTLVVLQLSWSLIGNMQAESRVHRIGAEHHRSVNIIRVIALDTVETKQVATLNVRRQRLDEINQDRDRLRAAGLSTDHLDLEEAQLMATDLSPAALLRGDAEEDVP
jgi:SNF2 family DNA or RNA helicase